MNDGLGLGNLRYYLKLGCEKAGVNWNWENDNEVDAILDEVRAVARRELAPELDQLQELQQRLEALERRINELTGKGDC